MPSPVVGLILWVFGGFHGMISTYMGNREWGKSVHIITGVIGHASNVQYSEYSPNYWCFICCSFSSFRWEVTQGLHSPCVYTFMKSHGHRTIMVFFWLSFIFFLLLNSLEQTFSCVSTVLCELHILNISIN